ncbi:MAG: PAS domain-containing protein [Elusimicrobia bacterium]|nr:PAS domain-containing protein [Elusimicrobiota bacterium]
MSAPADAVFDALTFLSGLRESNDIKVWTRILDKAAAAVEADAGVYYFWDTMARQLVPFHALGGLPVLGLPSVGLGAGLLGRSAKYHEALLASDLPGAAGREPTDGRPGGGGRSALFLPLSVHLDFVGAFALFDPPGRAFTEDDLRLARAIVEQTGHAIRRLRLEDMVGRVTAYNASILDNLSGGFLAVDLQGRVMICNPAAKRLLDLSGETLDMPVEAALTAVPELAAVLRRTMQSRQTAKRQEVRFSRGGTQRVIGYSTLLIKDAQGAFAGAGVMFQDITPQAR